MAITSDDSLIDSLTKPQEVSEAANPEKWETVKVRFESVQAIFVQEGSVIAVHSWPFTITWFAL